MSERRVVAVGPPQSFRQQVARALESVPDEVEWVEDATDGREATVTTSGPANLMVISPGISDAEAVDLAEFVAERSPFTAVVLVRDHVPDGLLPVAMRAGVRDVVDLSRGHIELKEALIRALGWSANLRAMRDDIVTEAADERGSIISIFSSKGGTGKTFLSTNLAAALAQQTGQDTAVVDLDLQMGDVLAYFGKEPARAVHDLLSRDGVPDTEDILSAGTVLDEHLWGFGAPLDPAADTVSGEAVGKLLRRMRGTFRYTVVDSPAGYTDQALASMEVADSILLVTGLDVVGLQHLSVALDTLLSLGVSRERLRVVLNRAESKVGLSTEEVERVMKLRVDAMIPSSRLVPLCLNKGRPVYLEEPKSDVAQAVARLAKTMIEAAPDPAQTKAVLPGLARGRQRTAAGRR